MSNSRTNYPKILMGNLQLGPYPMEKLKKVEKPTTIITDNVNRFDARQTGFARALRGELGEISRAKSSPRGTAVAISSAMTSAMNIIGKPNGQKNSIPKISPAVNFSPNVPDNPEVLSRHIKSFAYFLGADIVGICKLPQWAIYSHDSRGNPIELHHRYAICIVVDQGRETMDASTGNDWISNSQSFRGYTMCGFIGSIVEEYIRKLGYSTRLHYALDYQVVVPPLLLLSGIGEVSRAGIILNPFLGLRFKASVVTTDLSLEPDKPVDFGLQDFCNKCKKCAIECPSKSIPIGDKVIKNGYENWDINAITCTKYRLGNPNGLMCGRCIKVCPWNKPSGWTHDLVRWMVEHTPFLNGPIIKMDKILGYDTSKKEKQWWFD
jgi:reductive dehalogenase